MNAQTINGSGDGYPAGDGLRGVPDEVDLHRRTRRVAGVSTGACATFFAILSATARHQRGENQSQHGGDYSQSGEDRRQHGGD